VSYDIISDEIYENVHSPWQQETEERKRLTQNIVLSMGTAAVPSGEQRINSNNSRISMILI